MDEREKHLEEVLQRCGGPFERFEHAAVYTSKEARAALPELSAVAIKNLFLRNQKGDRHLLVSVHEHKQLDLQELGRALGIGRLSFASTERLKRYLGVDAGSVTLFGAINDAACAVEVIIDSDVWDDANRLTCHPLRNTATVLMPVVALKRFFAEIGHSFTVMQVPGHTVPAE